MGYIRKPSYFFLSETETGINTLTVGSTISVASYSGAAKQFQKVSVGTLSDTSTLLDAFNAGNIVEIGTGAGGGSVSVSDNTTTNASYFPLFVDVTSGTPTVTSVSSTKLSFNPASGQLTSTEFNATSDINKKTAVENISSALETIQALQGVEFNWKDSGLHSSGVIAQDLAETLPFLVQESSDGLSVNYNGIIGYLIEAIKELNAKVK